jgi:branched-chain amino acid transport system permease protein
MRAPAPVVALALAAVLPLFVAEAGTALENMVLAAAYVIMALGLNIVVGFAGLLDLGYVAFFAIGAHVAAYFGSAFWGIHVNFLVILLLAIVATTIAGVLIGVPTLRLRGDYIGIVTLAFGEIIGQVVSNGGEIELFGGTLTGGPQGISGIDRIDLPLLERFGALDLRPWFWFALALVALMLLVNVRLRDSRVGRAWIAVREDERAAAGAGVPVVRTKLLAYGVGAALGGVSGAFLASYLSIVNPKQFTFSFSIFILAMVVIGGLGSIWGVVVGAIALSAVNNHLLPRVLYDLPSSVGLDFDMSEISSGIYGFLLVLVMLLRPDGLLSSSRISRGTATREARG